MRNCLGRSSRGPRCSAVPRQGRLPRAATEPAHWPVHREAQPDLRLLLCSARQRRAAQGGCPLPEAAACGPGRGPRASREDPTDRAASVPPSGDSGPPTIPRGPRTPSGRPSSLLISAPRPPARVVGPKTPPHLHRPHCGDPDANGPEGPHRKVLIRGEPAGPAPEQRDLLSSGDPAACRPVRIRRHFTLQGCCPRPQQPALPSADEGTGGCVPPTRSTSSRGHDISSAHSATRDGESLLPSCLDPRESGKEVEAEEPAASPLASHAPPKPSAQTATKRKASPPSALPLPLPLPLPVPWGRGELPPPAKLPCLELQRGWDVAENSLSCKRQVCKTEACESRTGAAPHGSATVPASSVLPPDADTGVPSALPTSTAHLPALPTTAHVEGHATGAPIRGADSSNPEEAPTPKIPSGRLAPAAAAVPHSTPGTNLEVLKNENEGRSKATTPPPSVFPKPPPPGLLPLPCPMEFPVPMCVDFPLPLSFPALPSMVPRTVNSLKTDTTTVFVTLAPRVCSQVAMLPATRDDTVDMDTTPPSEAVIFTSSPVSSTNSYSSLQASCSLQQGHLLNGAVPPSPPTPHPYPFPQTPCIMRQGPLPNGPVPTNLPPPQPYRFPPVPCSLAQGQLVMGPVPTNPPPPMGPCPSLVFTQSLVPQNSPWSTNVIPSVHQQSASVPTSVVPSVLPIMGSVTVPISGANASSPAKPPMDDDGAMDTTPPSKASVFQLPVSMNDHPALNQVSPPSDNLPHRDTISTMQGPDNSALPSQLMQGQNPNTRNISNARAIPHPTLGVFNGQCDNSCFQSDPSLITPPADVLTAPPVQLPRDTTMQSSHMDITLSSPAVNPAVITQQASSSNSQCAVYTATPAVDTVKISMLTGSGDTNSPIHQATPGTSAVVGNKVLSNAGHSRLGTPTKGSRSDSRASHVNRRRRLQV